MSQSPDLKRLISEKCDRLEISQCRKIYYSQSVQKGSQRNLLQFPSLSQVREKDNCIDTLMGFMWYRWETIIKESAQTSACYWTLVRGVASWLFWEFFHTRWKILFSRGEEHERWMRGGDAHTRWEYQHTVRMATWGGCKVGMVTWGGNIHARWMQGENVHTRWEWSCEVGMVTRDTELYEPPSEILHSLIFNTVDI